MRYFLVVITLLSSVVSSAAQELPVASARERLGLAAPRSGAPLETFFSEESTVNLTYDDGEADNGLNAVFPNAIEFAMRFDAGAAGSLDQFQVCLQRLFFVDSGSGTFNLNIYGATSAGPGALLHAFEATINNVPVTGLVGSFRTLNLSSPVSIPASFFVGIEMDSLTSDFYLCVDEDGLKRPIFASLNDGPWLDLSGVEPSVKKLMVRARVDTDTTPPPPPPPPMGETCPIGACFENANTICLNEGRFKVTAGFDTPNDNDDLLEPMGADRLTGDTGYLFFTNSNNVEVVVKVLNACGAYGHYWAFLAGLTNVEVEVRICDVQTGKLKVYSNSQGTAFAPIQDTNAFATCP